MSRSVLPTLSRRAALVTGSGSIAAILTGCGSPATTDPVATGTPASDAGTRLDRDEELVRRALDRESRTRRDAVRTAQRHPGLRRALRRTAEVHQAHTDLLAQAIEDTGARLGVRPIPRDPRAAARALAGHERALADAHARAALEARSGRLARVLAGMAAAADQQAQVLDGLTGTVGRRG